MGKLKQWAESLVMPCVVYVYSPGDDYFGERSNFHRRECSGADEVVATVSETSKGSYVLFGNLEISAVNVTAQGLTVHQFKGE